MWWGSCRTRRNGHGRFLINDVEQPRYYCLCSIWRTGPAADTYMLTNTWIIFLWWHTMIIKMTLVEKIAMPGWKLTRNLNFVMRTYNIACFPPRRFRERTTRTCTYKVFYRLLVEFLLWHFVCSAARFRHKRILKTQ